MNKLDKWESEIKGLEERIIQDDEDINKHYDSIKTAYGKVKDMTVDYTTTSNSIKEIGLLNKKIEDCESSIKSAKKSIKKRLENIGLENKLKQRRY